MKLQPAPGWVPAGERVYAIGDIHGCAERLRTLHGLIAADLAARPAKATLIHLGDYVDKGPDPAGVLAHLVAGDPVPGCLTVSLAGNHEALLLGALVGEPLALADFLAWGGRETLASYGFDPEAGPAAWDAAFPDAHRRWLEQRPMTYRLGGYFFTHAGIRPGVPLDRQDARDLTGIRQSFLASEADHGVVVVHGHTAALSVTVRANRIGLDTAAWSGGPLSCAVLEGEVLGLLEG
ncbi:serine/threonine protein phosphatase 1 [Humitalea rosea]|uniref:Serine/threonine protein phosphatase 1 n=1 Tax=Humitalea rosea TaxID=990373 RepID=A0A2W7IKB4_9PROT|nr:metallophosphoesterase [Humitalea rosea]PZW38973.1 serine/threonine protein phosphatase 1 [Humitalea rosea]